MAAAYTVIVLLILGLLFLFAAVKVAREYERGVVFRLGRLIGLKGPGVFLLIPFIDKAVKVDLRTITLNVPPQEVITKDNVTVKVNAVAYFRVIDAARSIVQVENYLVATSQIAQTTLRSVLGQVDLDQLLSERDQINERLQTIIDEQTEPWGIKVGVVEVKDVELPTSMQRAIARQAEAERERRAKIIAADGEFQASEKLSQAASVIRSEPGGASAALPADHERDRQLGDDDHADPAVPGRDARGAQRGGCAKRQARGIDRGTNPGRRAVRAIWNGFISFGLVTIPVSVGLAQQRSDVSFRTLSRATGQPVKQKRWDPDRDVEVSPDDTVKGWEVSKGRYLQVEDSELERFAARQEKTVQILQFVELSEVDPVFFERAYWLEPQERAERPYALLTRAMEHTGRAAMGRFVLSTKEHLVLLRPGTGCWRSRRSTTPRTYGCATSRRSSSG